MANNRNTIKWIYSSLFIMLLMAVGCQKGNEQSEELGSIRTKADTFQQQKDIAALSNQFENHLEELYNEINFKDLNLNYDVFRYAMIGYYNLKQHNKLNDRNLI